jgi:acyl CoA:acetate/3-ketoacid CoA transferase
MKITYSEKKKKVTFAKTPSKKCIRENLIGLYQKRKENRKLQQNNIERAYFIPQGSLIDNNRMIGIKNPILENINK